MMNNRRVFEKKETRKLFLQSEGPSDTFQLPSSDLWRVKKFGRNFFNL